MNQKGLAAIMRDVLELSGFWWSSLLASFNVYVEY